MGVEVAREHATSSEFAEMRAEFGSFIKLAVDLERGVLARTMHDMIHLWLASCVRERYYWNGVHPISLLTLRLTWQLCNENLYCGDASGLMTLPDRCLPSGRARWPTIYWRQRDSADKVPDRVTTQVEPPSRGVEPRAIKCPPAPVYSDRRLEGEETRANWE